MNRIKFFSTLCLAFMALSFVACKKDPLCIVMHAPLYPSGGQSVTYTAKRESAFGNDRCHLRRKDIGGTTGPGIAPREN